MLHQSDRIQRQDLGFDVGGAELLGVQTVEYMKFIIQKQDHM